MRLWAARQRGSAPGPGRLHADVRSHGRVLVVGLLYIGINNWLPTIGKTFGSLSNLEIASPTAMPWACAAVFWGRHSDRWNERCISLAIPLVIGAAGFAAPSTMGWIKQETGSSTYALFVLAGETAASGPIALLVRPGRNAVSVPLATEQVPAGAPARMV